MILAPGNADASLGITEQRADFQVFVLVYGIV